MFFILTWLALVLVVNAEVRGTREIHKIRFGASTSNLRNASAVVQIPTHDILDDLMQRRLPGHVATSVKDVSTGGLEGLNIKLGLPFKIDQYIAGFKLRLGSLRNSITKKASRYHLTPLLDTLYGKTVVDTPFFPGTATVDCDYRVDSRTLYAHTRWISKERDIEVFAAADTDNFLTDIGFELTVSNTTEKTRVSLDASYDLKNSKLDGSTKIAIGDTAVKVTLDHVVKVIHKIDDRNIVTPSISLKNGAKSLGWKHLFATGSVAAELTPAEGLDLIWKDEGLYGTWTTTASVPMDGHEKSKISVTHDWKY